MEEYKEMSETQIAGRELDFNAKGFLANFGDWSKEVAESIAADEGLSLSDCHWTVINFLREYYSEFEHPPSPRIVIKGIGEHLTINAPCTRRTLEGLFPGGGCKQACRIAGLPDYYCHSC
jgi:tRNA 2-thiouridine synthesizing protein E